MIYRAIQLIQIFLADERTNELTKVIQEVLADLKTPCTCLYLYLYLYLFVFVFVFAFVFNHSVGTCRAPGMSVLFVTTHNRMLAPHVVACLQNVVTSTSTFV